MVGTVLGLSIFVGPSGVGKSTEIIKLLRRESNSGRRVALYLANHPLLLSRRNVKPGGYMGCRTLGLKFPITDVLTEEGLKFALDNRARGDLVVVDEVQYFNDSICETFVSASNRGIEIILGMPSENQQKLLAAAGATVVAPNHADEIAKFGEMLRKNPPFPGEAHAYQPLFGVDFKSFRYVRNDCPERLRLMLDSCRKAIDFTTEAPAGKTYLDVGCCSGYFVEGMASAGFKSTGVDVQKIYVDMGRTLSNFRESGTTYIQENACDFSKREEKYDVISAFATIQWIMAQRGYQDGLDCLVNLMRRTTGIFVLEMGYTSEDIYKGKIGVEIDRKWTEDVLHNEGAFPDVKGYWAGHNGLWRDVFIASR